MITQLQEDSLYMQAQPREMRDWAFCILSADSLDDKLFAPKTLTDHCPGPAIQWDLPSRPLDLTFTKRAKSGKLPPFHDHDKADNRAACLHRFAGHELLAVEIMAYALLAFPDAPKHFRRGVAATLKEEQAHVRLYVRRLNEMGVRFGDMPLHLNFWKQVPYLQTPQAYVSVMNLTFEMANLDFAPMYGASFARNGDSESAALMQRILHDEIAHVSFGWHWLKKLKRADQSMWEAWSTYKSPLLTPKRASGFVLHEEPRRKAGVDSDFIDQLKTHR